METIGGLTEPELLRLLLEQVKDGAVSIDEAIDYLWVKPMHMVEMVQLRCDLNEALRNQPQPQPKKKRGRKPVESVAIRRWMMFQAWLLSVDFWDAEPTERAALAGEFADSYKVDESEVWKYAAKPSMGLVKSMKEALGDDYG